MGSALDVKDMSWGSILVVCGAIAAAIQDISIVRSGDKSDHSTHEARTTVTCIVTTMYMNQKGDEIGLQALATSGAITCYGKAGRDTGHTSVFQG